MSIRYVCSFHATCKYLVLLYWQVCICFQASSLVFYCLLLKLSAVVMELLALVAPRDFECLFLIETLFSCKSFEQGPACYFRLNQGLHFFAPFIFFLISWSVKQVLGKCCKIRVILCWKGPVEVTWSNLLLKAGPTYISLLRVCPVEFCVSLRMKTSSLFR